MKLGFYAGKCLPVHARSVDERPLGGSETGLIRLAEILSKRGHEVIVFTSHKNPPESQPKYVPHNQVMQHGEFDIFIMLKDWWPTFFGVRARRLWFWTGDPLYEYTNFGFGDRRVAMRLDRFLAVSNWHAHSMCKYSGFPVNKTTVIGNGIHLPYFEGSEVRNRKRLIYSSAPDRGLELAPPIVLELKRRHPDLEFHVFSGLKVYDREQPYQGAEVSKFEELSKALMQIPGCILHGNVIQKDLAREFMKSAILFYPNNTPESCCITAIEAQAAGCPIVTSAIGALPEIVANSGILIRRTPDSNKFVDDFVETTDRLLKDDELWNRLSKNGFNRAVQLFGWEKVADRFEMLAEKQLKNAPLKANGEIVASCKI